MGQIFFSKPQKCSKGIRHEQDKCLYSHTMQGLNSSSSHGLFNKGHCSKLIKLVSHILEAMERWRAAKRWDVQEKLTFYYLTLRLPHPSGISLPYAPSEKFINSDHFFSKSFCPRRHKPLHWACARRSPLSLPVTIQPPCPAASVLGMVIKMHS